MDAKTLEALKASIAKWEKNTVAEAVWDFHTSSRECPLCALFHASDCEGCPVSARTVRPICMGSPYEEAPFAKASWRRDGGARARAAAREEVAFLKSLLPEEAS